MTLIQKSKKRLYFSVAAYFRFFANLSLKRWRPRIIAITGSVGKTTMLNLLEAELGSKAHYSHNANSAYGVAFDILGLKGVRGSKLRWISLFISAPFRGLFYRRREKFYVVEIDGERPHEVEVLAKWLKPEVTLWVSLGISHAIYYDAQVKSGQFPDLDYAIAHEFAYLPRYTKKLVIYDADNSLIAEHLADISAKTVPVSQSADLKAYQVFPDHTEYTVGKTNFHINSPSPRSLAVQLAMLDRLMSYLKLPLSSDLSNFYTPPGRNNFLRGKNGLQIIDSSYNAHLISMASILDMTRELKAPHKWLIIGDIIEQGESEESGHKDLAALILKTKPERVILVGRRTHKYTLPLLKPKLGDAVASFPNPKSAYQYLEKHLTGKETLTFKGSQYLEWIIEKLLADPADIALLARQDKAFKKRRASWELE